LATLTHERSLPSRRTPRRRRWLRPSPLLAPLLLFACVVVTATAYVAYVLWPRWPDAPVALDEGPGSMSSTTIVTMLANPPTISRGANILRWENRGSLRPPLKSTLTKRVGPSDRENVMRDALRSEAAGFSLLVG